MNDHEAGSICAPATLVAPETVTVNVVSWFKRPDGVNVAVFVAALYAVEPAMTLRRGVGDDDRRAGHRLTEADRDASCRGPRRPRTARESASRSSAGPAVVKVRVAGVITAPPSDVAPDTVTE